MSDDKIDISNELRAAAERYSGYTAHLFERAADKIDALHYRLEKIAKEPPCEK